jgi:hypothetical protein
MLKRLKIGNLLVDRCIRLLYTILSLYLGANYLTTKEFFVLQQITLFQSFLIFAIALPSPTILVRLGNSSLTYFKSLLISTMILRAIIGIITIFLFCIYLFYNNNSFSDIKLIAFGLIPLLISSIFLIDILPHIFNFDGRKNWELIVIFSFFFVAKFLVILLTKSINFKIIVEMIEAIIVVCWISYTYLQGLLRKKLLAHSIARVKKIVKVSTGLYLNGVLSVFILRIDQFALINFVDKKSLSNYMLIVSISSLFVTPLSLLGERLSFVMSIAKSQSMHQFRKESLKFLYLFAISSAILYLVFSFLFIPISTIVFKRDLSKLLSIGLILGTTIFSNSVGMIFGQINSILNGGMYTMKRSFAGCICLFLGVSIGFKLYGITGVAIASASSLFLTNVLFWFFSKKVRLVLFKP